MSEPTQAHSKLTEEQNFRKAVALANQFRARDTIKGLTAIFTNYAVIGACVFVAEWTSSNTFRTGTSTPADVTISWTVYLIATAVIASRMRAFECLVHEASHLNLFRSPSAHYRLQFLYAFPVFRLLEDYRRSHLIHHSHLGDPTRDPDVIRILELGLDGVHESPIYYLVGLPLSGYVHFEYLTTTFAEFWTSRTQYPLKALYWAAIVAAVCLTKTSAWFACYYLVPLFVVLPVTRYWAEAAEHLGLNLGARFGNSRTNVGWSQRWYMHPHNDGFHAVHHLHGQVPFHALPAAHEALMRENKGFREGLVVSNGLLDSFRQMAERKTVLSNVVGRT
ncbi:unnamed protein product [Discula destructiva]